MDYLLQFLTICSIYCLLTQSFNLALGVARVFNLAHFSACALGAYATAILITDYRANLATALCLSAAATLPLGLVIGTLQRRLSVNQLVFATLGLQALILTILENSKSLTNGVAGISLFSQISAQDLSVPGLSAVQRQSLYILAVSVLLLGALYLLFKNPFVRSVKATAYNPQAAASLGVSSGRTGLALAASCMIAGVAGGLYALHLGFIVPSVFSSHELMFVISAVIICRPGYFWGVILSTAALLALTETLRLLYLPPELTGPLRQLLYAIIICVVIYTKRDRLFLQLREQ